MQKFLERIRAADNPLKRWPAARLVVVLCLLPRTQRILLQHLKQWQTKRMTLLQLMDLVLLDNGGPAVNLLNSPLFAMTGVGKAGYLSAAKALTELDLGPRCNELWRSRIAKLKGPWQLTPPQERIR